MNNDLHHFEQFMKRREDVARAYVRSDAEPLGRIVTRVSPATFFGPQQSSQRTLARRHAPEPLCSSSPGRAPTPLKTAMPVE
jgi:hypothetical protein